MPKEKRLVFRPLTGLAILVVLVCVIIGVVYMTTAAKDLPSFFPGHQANVLRKHTKHGLAMFGLAVVALVGAWFSSGPDRPGR